ncbi:MAG TPA: transcriptional regulator GcvA [Steroidobacteraceae bacterium]|jgi:LysR family glycine cleavage system transcriptional activator
MPRKLPPLSSLRAFEVVARHETFRAAAEELHVTAAAVIQQVKALEGFVGRKLLRRHSRGYSLTPDGAAGLEALRSGFDHLSAAVDAMTSAGHRILTVSAVPSLSAEWLVPRLHRFREQHPGIDVLLHPSVELVDLERSRVDLGVRYGSGIYPGVVSERLFDDEIFPVYSPRMLNGRRPLRSPGDLRAFPLIHTQWTPETGHWPGWSEWLRAAGVTGIDVNKGLRLSDGALVIQAALGGQGVALGSRALALDHLAAGRLIRPFELSLVTDFAYYVVCAKNRAGEPDLMAFRRWVISEAQAEPRRRRR